MSVRVVRAVTETELDHVRHLMRAFVRWHRERHPDELALIDSYFDEAAFSAELAALPGKYAPPSGSLLLADVDGAPAGCVALHDLGSGFCEMKRMFVPESFRGRGVGSALASQILTDARDAGYRLMRLDTSIRQAEAIRLYERSGFRRVPAYYPVSPRMAEWLVFFERSL
ncbi:GNAT family N-acetyltransferase [Siculibacillus lacustris]|uniref:GNAT family N-acetyltransferase n=1 Tax=Siculibacillus lacustris TaxID=1549641 RepID=A0A4Q9VHS1_9HYPH|nr:GNAT family N-acetyltransferase [Siculibacillus lacustris]TBW33807.1 GNAT family N-acetyltransferase [Siculibacillus lacustris]